MSHPPAEALVDYWIETWNQVWDCREDGGRGSLMACIRDDEIAKAWAVGRNAFHQDAQITKVTVLVGPDGHGRILLPDSLVLLSDQEALRTARQLALSKLTSAERAILGLSNV